MMPTTPSGTRICLSCSPLGRVDPRMTSPTGSGSPATWRRPSAIASTRFASSDRRSTSASERPPSRPRATSSALAASTSSVCATSASAIASSAWSFAARGIGASPAAATRARRATSSTWSAEASAVTPEGYDGSGRPEAGRRRRKVLLPPGEDALRPEDEHAGRLALGWPEGVLLLVALHELRQQRPVHRLDAAFEHDDLVAALQVDDGIRSSGEVARLRRAGIGREHHRSVEPQTPHRHRVRPAVRPRRTDPVVPRPRAFPLHPRPRQLPVIPFRNAITPRHDRSVRTHGLPGGVQRAALGVAGGALDTDDGALVELRQAACAGVRARAAQPGDDAVDEVLDAGLVGVEIHARGRDALLEQSLAGTLERRLLLGAHPDRARRCHAERLLEQPPVGVAMHVAG